MLKRSSGDLILQATVQELEFPLPGRLVRTVSTLAGTIALDVYNSVFDVIRDCRWLRTAEETGKQSEPVRCADSTIDLKYPGDHAGIR